MKKELASLRSGLLTLGLLAASCLSGSSQSITPVWEYLVNHQPTPIPILTNSTPWVEDLDNGDGKTLMDTIGPLRRYDANRLVLGVRENGIDETAPMTPAQAALAAAYPDRSLIWINPTNGQPLGLALTIGLTPVPLTAEIVALGGNTTQFYWSFDVSADGYVYTGYKNQIIRYAPNGSGGISPTPTVVFTMDGNTATNGGGISVGQLTGYRWQHVRVQGAGTNTIIFAGGGGGRGAWMLTTADGTNFTAGLHMNGGFGNAAGGISHLIPSRETGGDYWFFGGSYPNNSSGADTKLARASGTPAPWPATFGGSPGWNSESDPNTNALSRYTANFSLSADAHADLDFVVHYSAPAYNHSAVGGYKPGWLALHNVTNGAFIAAHELCVTEADELLTLDNASLFVGGIGAVSISPLADGTAEVLWSGGIYGYGRYIVGSPRYTRAASMTKNIQPLWEQLQGQPSLKLPIIDTDVNANPVPSTGSSVMHVFTGFKKYDASRFLLGIRDNGINETVAHNTNLATAYPDRSLHWISADTGAPLGTALVVSYPAGTVGDDNHLNMAFGVDSAGVLYVGVGDTIRRYAPSGSGFAAPTVAFTAPGGTPQPAKIQFSEFRVSGSGASTVIVVGNRDWYGDVDRILTTSDGLTYTEATAIPTGFGTGGGGISSVLPDPALAGDNVVFRTSYPSTSNGVDTRMHRRRQAGGVGLFNADVFNAEAVTSAGITNSVDVIYRTLFLTDAQSLPGLDYVVGYSTPSFRTFDNPGVQAAIKGSSPDPMPYQPGWLAIHDQNTGEVRGLRKLNVTEALNVIPTTTSPPIDFYTGWFVYALPQGGVELYPVLNSASEVAGVEILWWSATYGYGRYYIDTAPLPASSGLRASIVNGKLQLDWNGIAAVQAASAVEGPYETISGACSGPYTYNGAAPKYFRLRLQ